MNFSLPNKEPPRAESHAWWCERSENESRKKTTSFASDFRINPIRDLDNFCKLCSFAWLWRNLSYIFSDAVFTSAQCAG